MTKPDQLGLPEPPLAPAGHGVPPTLLYTIERPRNGYVRCGGCRGANHETRLWCTTCGHQMGVPLADCVCETCVQA